MAKVLSLPAHFDDFYHPSSSPRCRSPQPPYDTHSDTYDHSPDFGCQQDYPLYTPHMFPPPSDSSILSSPELSSIASIDSSVTSSVASSVCLDDTTKTSDFEDEDDALFPVYDYTSLSAACEKVASFQQEEEEEEEREEECDDLQSSVETVTALDTEMMFLDSSAADDTFVRHEPTRHVDYLSHTWKEEDIWASWRYMVRNRNNHPNAPRLENASWRTWAKEKNRLRTISPESLNWLKDCDVTWLYGPLLVGTAHSKLSPDSPPGSPSGSKTQKYNPKPILKKRSVSELILQRSLSSSNLLKQATAALESQQSSRPRISGRASSDASTFPSKTTSTITRGSRVTTSSSPSPSPSPNKHIHFNNQVQQCIAIHQDDDGVSDYYGDDSDIDMLDSDEEERGRTRERRPIIAMLPSTTLKYVEEPVKKATSFLPFNSFFSRSSADKKPFLLEDDEDLADLDWAPKTTYAPRKRSPTGDRTMEASYDDDDLQLPTYSYEDSDEDHPSGLINRAVDYVNTARDIAHVLWNVGWRR